MSFITEPDESADLINNMYLIVLLTSVSFWTFMIMFRSPTSNNPDTKLSYDDERMREIDEMELNKYRDLPFYPMFVDSHHHYLASTGSEDSSDDSCSELSLIFAKLAELENSILELANANNLKHKNIKSTIYKNKKNVISILKKYVDAKIDKWC